MLKGPQNKNHLEICRYTEIMAQTKVTKTMAIDSNLLVGLSFLILFKIIFRNLKGKATVHQKEENTELLTTQENV